MEDDPNFLSDFDDRDGKFKGELCWEAGACNRQGKRKYNEDRLVVELDLQADAELYHRNTSSIGEPFGKLPGGNKQAFCGIFDGHSGVHAAIYLKENLHRYIYR